MIERCDDVEPERGEQDPADCRMQFPDHRSERRSFGDAVVDTAHRDAENLRREVTNVVDAVNAVLGAVQGINQVV